MGARIRRMLADYRCCIKSMEMQLTRDPLYSPLDELCGESERVQEPHVAYRVTALIRGAEFGIRGSGTSLVARLGLVRLDSVTAR
ncbi:hypothetical protein DPMN_047560 [Dreissena polymorpha]|uniref:Uncharacterized protein n=1 Tax=Dreissena polymorpha TaxID=45954 RepID=A0A9D4I373_DREPO|nr:hypothetical protein DPMN_047560 [Dreissena polymorpha]